MKVKFKQLHENAVIPFKTHERDFCYDCIATSCEEIAPNVYKYGLGFALEIVDDRKHEGSILSIDVRPRSSIYKTGMVLSNSQGTVDEPYRGEICAIFYHVLSSMPKYEVGDKICQIKLGVTGKMEFEVVNELSSTERNDGGWGSTGN